MYPQTNGRIARCIGYSASFLFIATAAAQNVAHAFALGSRTSELAAVVLSLGSVAGALLGPISFASAFESFRRFAIGRGLVGLFLGVLCFTYAAVSALGFNSGTRDSAMASAAAEVDRYAAAKTKLALANAELAKLADEPKGTRKEQTDRAARKAKLEGDRDAAERIIAAGSKATTADPTAAALASYAAALGYAVKAEDLAPWIVLGTVVFFEAGAALSLIVVGGLPAPAPRRQEREAPAEAPAVAEPVAAPQIEAPEALADEPKRPGRKRGTALEVVKDRIAASGGRIEGSLEEISERLGLTKSSAHRALHSLAAAGVIALATSPAGTLVTLR